MICFGVCGDEVQGCKVSYSPSIHSGHDTLQTWAYHYHKGIIKSIIVKTVFVTVGLFRIIYFSDYNQPKLGQEWVYKHEKRLINDNIFLWKFVFQLLSKCY